MGFSSDLIYLLEGRILSVEGSPIKSTHFMAVYIFAKFHPLKKSCNTIDP